MKITKDAVARLQRRIDRACAKAVKAGVVLVPGHFGRYSPGSTCCPMTCVAGPGLGAGKDPWAVANDILDLSDRQMWDFIDGFDDNHFGNNGRPLYKVGKFIRNKYLPGAPTRP